MKNKLILSKIEYGRQIIIIQIESKTDNPKEEAKEILRQINNNFIVILENDFCAVLIRNHESNEAIYRVDVV
jgi:hypothetical protein